MFLKSHRALLIWKSYWIQMISVLSLATSLKMLNSKVWILKFRYTKIRSTEDWSITHFSAFLFSIRVIYQNRKNGYTMDSSSPKTEPSFKERPFIDAPTLITDNNTNYGKTSALCIFFVLVTMRCGQVVRTTLWDSTAST